MTLKGQRNLTESEKEKIARLTDVMEDYKKRGTESPHIMQTELSTTDETKKVLVDLKEAEKLLIFAKTLKPVEQSESIVYKVKPLLIKIERSLWKVSFIGEDLQARLNKLRKAVREAESSRGHRY